MFTHLGNAMWLRETHEWLKENNPFEFEPLNREQRRHPDGRISTDFGHTSTHVNQNYKVIPRSF